jgi:hypothetical protein
MSASILLLSVDAVEHLLSDVTFCIESKDAFFEFLLGFGSDYFRLLPHVRWDRLTGSLPPAFVKAAWVVPDDALWAGISNFVRKALGFADHLPLMTNANAQPTEIRVRPATPLPIDALFFFAAIPFFNI